MGALGYVGWVECATGVSRSVSGYLIISHRIGFNS